MKKELISKKEPQIGDLENSQPIPIAKRKKKRERERENACSESVAEQQSFDKKSWVGLMDLISHHSRHQK